MSLFEDAARAWTGKSLKKQIWEVIEICSVQSFMFFSHQSPIHFMPMEHSWGTFQSIPCPVKPTQGEEDAEGIAFNLFLDLRWHSRALFQMTRSYAGHSDTASETVWVRVVLNYVECFMWKCHGTGSEVGRNKSKHHPGLTPAICEVDTSIAHVLCDISLLDLLQGFFILPLIFSAGAVLLASSTFQAGNYLCSMADLKDLSRANGGINFHPWIREYEASGFEPILHDNDIPK